MADDRSSQLRDALDEPPRYLHALNQLMEELAGMRDVEALLDLAVSALANRFGAALARIWLHDEASQTLVLSASAGLSTRTTGSSRYRIPLDGHPYKLAEVIRRRQPVFSRDVTSDPQFEQDWVQQNGIRSFAGYPLLLGDRLLGVLVVFSRESLEEDFAQSVRLLSHHIAGTLVSARLLEAERRSTRQARELNRIAAALSSESHPETLLQMIADVGRELTGAESVGVVVEREEQGKRYFAFAARSGSDHLTLPATMVAEPEGPLAPLLRDGQVLRVGDMRQAPLFGGRHVEDIPLVSLLGAPLRGRDGRVTGALLIGHGSPDAFGEEHESLAVTLAVHAATAVENARVLEDARMSARRVRTLNEVGQALSAILDRNELLLAVQRFVSETMDASSFAVVLWDEEKQELQAVVRLEAGIDYGPATTPLGWGVVSRAIVTKKPSYIQHLEAQEPELVASMNWYGTEDTFTQAQLAAPMCVGDRVIGALSVQSYEPYAYSDADVEVIATIASQAAVALENVRLYEQLAASRQRLASALADLRETDRVKDYFLSAASHELKTPLTLVKGQLQLIEQETVRIGDNPRISRFTRVALRNVERMRRLIEGLLDVSRLDTGQMRLEMGPVDLAELARSVAESFEGHGYRAVVVSDIPDQSVPVLGDTDRLEQVLLNLLSNAQEYSPAGGKILLQVRADAGMGRVSVSDNGQGVPADDLERVFERFFQSSGTSVKRRSGGMGLGLYISRGIVEAHGGRIWAESEPGKGSTFTFELPLRG